MIGTSVMKELKKGLELVTRFILSLETFSRMFRTKISTHAGYFQALFPMAIF